MKKKVLLFIFCLTIFSGYSQTNKWSLVSKKEKNFSKQKLKLRDNKPVNFKVYALDYNAFKNNLLKSL